MDFQVVVGRVPEIQGGHLSPQELARINAYRKARAVAKKFPDSLVIGADTIVCLEHRTFGKPTDWPDACRMLEALQARAHDVITALCLIHLRDHRQKVLADTTQVVFRSLTAEQIQDYLQKIDPFDKAGAYAIQEHGDLLVEKISGSFSNVVGLPLEVLRTELELWQ
jgi:septum formation protein